jgi:hypothetical protein
VTGSFSERQFQWEADFSGTSFEFWVRRCAAGKAVKSAGVMRQVACARKESCRSDEDSTAQSPAPAQGQKQEQPKILVLRFFVR